MTTQLIDQLTELEKQTDADKHAAYVGLVVDIATGRLIDPTTIHAALQRVGRTATQLDSDLSTCQAVHRDLAVFATLPGLQQSLADAERDSATAAEKVREAEDRVSAATSALRAAEIAKVTRDRRVSACRAEVFNAEDVGRQLTNNGERRQYVPVAVRECMERVHRIGEERGALDLEYHENRRESEKCASNAEVRRQAIAKIQADWDDHAVWGKRLHAYYNAPLTIKNEGCSTTRVVQQRSAQNDVLAIRQMREMDEATIQRFTTEAAQLDADAERYANLREQLSDSLAVLETELSSATAELLKAIAK